MKMIAAIFTEGNKEALAKFTWRTMYLGNMHFQDAYDYDIQRLMRCDIHYSVPDGRIIPFCSYNSGPIYRTGGREEVLDPDPRLAEGEDRRRPRAEAHRDDGRQRRGHRGRRVPQDPGAEGCPGDVPGVRPPSRSSRTLSGPLAGPWRCFFVISNDGRPISPGRGARLRPAGGTGGSTCLGRRSGGGGRSRTRSAREGGPGAARTRHWDAPRPRSTRPRGVCMSRGHGGRSRCRCRTHRPAMDRRGGRLCTGCRGKGCAPPAEGTSRRLGEDVERLLEGPRPTVGRGVRATGDRRAAPAVDHLHGQGPTGISLVGGALRTAAPGPHDP